ncbi:hypothetical protein M9H77_14333 [Catharanthus roseus]|uniref:Uncharacterized protein n=1 Tax=Catharanthus roseus TaxID=4058 RepID=A0ACC0BMR6_CATRO|nr:hypothetical protein M9H77_14333 [Catharanthus roseus]
MDNWFLDFTFETCFKVILPPFPLKAVKNYLVFKFPRVQIWLCSFDGRLSSSLSIRKNFESQHFPPTIPKQLSKVIKPDGRAPAGVSREEKTLRMRERGASDRYFTFYDASLSFTDVYHLLGEISSTCIVN